MKPPLRQLGSDVGVDSSEWANGGDLLSAILDATNNESLSVVQAVFAATDAPASYEKEGRITEVRQDDPSDYAHGILKDGVSDGAFAKIGRTNQCGRAWGRYTEVGTEPGGDGLCIGHEIGGANTSPGQPALGQTNSKVLLPLVAGEYPGNTPFTAAAGVVAGTASFYQGIFVDQSAITDQQNGMAVGVRNLEGNYSAGFSASGMLQMLFVNQATMPYVSPGKCMIWGDTVNYVTYLLFNNGAGTLKIAFG